MLQFSYSFSIPLAIVFCKDSVDFIANHVSIFSFGVADEIKAGLRKGYCGGVDLSKCQWSLPLPQTPSDTGVTYCSKEEA